MEVHHHPKVEKKNLKEYFLEFLMIFLAVTMGFFAETIREKISESHREKDYIVGLINDIQSDTTDLKGLISRNHLEVKGIDSLLKVSKDYFKDIATQDSIYFYALQYSFSLHIFQFNDLTLVQLRNAGGYSLIKNGNVADSIALYESKNNGIKIQERFYIDGGSQTWSSFKQVFDGTIAGSFFASYERTKKIPSDFNVMISRDEEKMHILLNDYWALTGVVGVYNNMLKEHLEYLKRLIAFLKRNYDLE
jgi:hypothetical protein